MLDFWDPIGIIGLILQIGGFILVLRFWRQATAQDYENYKNHIEKTGHYKSFDHWWQRGKAIGFWFVIGGLLLQIIQMAFD